MRGHVSADEVPGGLTADVIVMVTAQIYWKVNSGLLNRPKQTHCTASVLHRVHIFSGLPHRAGLSHY